MQARNSQPITQHRSRRRTRASWGRLLTVWLGVQASYGADLEDAILSPELWSLDAARVQEQLGPLGFRPVSTQAGADLRLAKPEGRVFGQPPAEILVHFDQGRVRDITIMLHSRGDQGALGEADFRFVVTSVCGRVTHWAGNSGQPRRQETRPGRRYAAGRTWVRGDLRLDLEWAWSKEENGGEFQSEYLKAVLQPYDPSRRAAMLVGDSRLDSTTTKTAMLTLPEMRKRVERRANGDVVIPSVPMVDQGEKGYCAVATIERLLRFYGYQVDQHVLAQLAGSDADRGTDPTALVGAVRRMASQTKLRVVAVRDSEATAEWREENRIVTLLKNLLDLIRDYNRVARREKASEIKQTELFHSGSVTEVYRMMKPDLLRQAKLSDKVGLNRFKSDVQRFIDAGVPLVWGVTVGLVPEKEIEFSRAQIRGRPGQKNERILEGHLRLIVGYNASTGEVLYSDTWGAGHEEKRMSLEDAWVITEGLYAVVPSHVRL